jgi:hypothetical protein
MPREGSPHLPAPVAIRRPTHVAIGRVRLTSARLTMPTTIPRRTMGTRLMWCWTRSRAISPSTRIFRHGYDREGHKITRPPLVRPQILAQASHQLVVRKPTMPHRRRNWCSRPNGRNRSPSLTMPTTWCAKIASQLEQFEYPAFLQANSRERQRLGIRHLCRGQVPARDCQGHRRHRAIHD